MICLPTIDSAFQLLRHLTATSNLRTIKNLHARLLRTGILFDSLITCSKLIFAYTTTSPYKTTHQTLTNFFNFLNCQNPFPFNLLICEYCRSGFSILPLQTLSFMHGHGVVLDTYALCGALTAASTVRAVEFGQQMHAYVEKSGWSASVFLGSALVGLYARSLIIEDAEKVFDEIPMKNTVCANALLVGYTEAKLWAKVMELVRTMPVLNLSYDHFTLTAALSSCAALSTVDFGGQVHAHILKRIYNVKNDVFILSALIELYGKCGLVGKAAQVFNLEGFSGREEQTRDVVLWTSMLGAYGRNGHYISVVNFYKNMLAEGIRPDGVAFLTVISACAHTGQLNLGFEYFHSMVNDFGLDPGPEHYSCMIDLLCKAGELEKAWKMVGEMPCRWTDNCVPLWGALLHACKDRGNMYLGRLAAQKALELDSQNAGVYAMLLNFYARLGMWDQIDRMTQLMKGRGLKKDAGRSWIEVTS
ncbi:hypothetical protein Nepgr_015318 [Nepenthes gracilis]|uniref:Pentatricopeptide repeat-containing protein n=1 Tax=Nepenthes gracilis TaxID=150966 RepID=A0AAD3SLV7_NEPGR|nr:hypothetical protein Nepgr_015318 [Nepenthes gracilis]